MLPIDTVYHSETKQKKPVIGKGFKTAFADNPATRQVYKIKILIEDAHGLTLRPCAGWQSAVDFVKQRQDCYAVLRYRDVMDGEWKAYKAFYPVNWPYEHVKLIDPNKQVERHGRATPALYNPVDLCTALPVKPSEPSLIIEPLPNASLALRQARLDNLMAKNKERAELAKMNARRFDAIQAFKPLPVHFKQLDLFEDLSC